MVSCEKEAAPNPRFATVFSKSPIDGIVDAGPISFDNPQIGQRNHYVFTEIQYLPVEHKTIFEQHALDTLVIAITDQIDDRWIIREYFKNNTSRYFQRDLRYNADADTIVGLYAEYSFSYIGNKVSFSLRLPEIGKELSSFFRYRSGFLPVLDLDPDENQIRSNELALPYFGRADGQWYGYTPTVDLAGHRYEEILTFHDQYIHEELDSGFGQTILYNADLGLVASYFSFESDLSSAGGMMLIPR